MLSDSQGQDSGQHDKLKGWDKGAFWFPTLDRRGALLGTFVLLLALHFDELFGIAGSQQFVAGWLPATFAYHIALNVLHVGFLVLIYLNWPDPDEHGIDPDELDGEVETGPKAPPTEAAVTEGD